jgi:hypothetical protein
METRKSVDGAALLIDEPLAREVLYLREMKWK